jgi:hypothetical protein
MDGLVGGWREKRDESLRWREGGMKKGGREMREGHSRGPSL